MKQIILILACSLLSLGGFSQKPEKIYGNARQRKSVNYYKEQAVAWKKYVDEHPKDPNGWFNYYYVNRNLLFNDTAANRLGAEQSQFVQKIVDEMGKQVPDSYEYNLCKWMVSGFDMKMLPYLQKAAALGEGRTEYIDFMINIGELTRNINDRDLYSKKKFEAGQFSTGIIYYNYNVLMGLEPNSILITSGDNDTYPIWLLQAQGIRKDITVMNVSLLQLDDYRSKLFKEFEIDAWPFIFKSNDPKAKEDFQRYKTGIIKHITENKKGCAVHVALTACGQDDYVSTIEQNLYLTGLTYLYSKTSVDNIAVLKKNVEQLYALDYIDKAFYQDLSPDMVKMINGNYLVPFLKLYDHYKLSGDVQRAEWVKSRLLAVSKETENEAEIKKRVALNR